MESQQSQEMKRLEGVNSRLRSELIDCYLERDLIRSRLSTPKADLFVYEVARKARSALRSVRDPLRGVAPRDAARAYRAAFDKAIRTLEDLHATASKFRLGVSEGVE